MDAPTSAAEIRRLLDQIPNNVFRQNTSRHPNPEFREVWTTATEKQQKLLESEQRLAQDALQEKLGFNRLKLAVLNAKKNERFEKKPSTLTPVPVLLANGGTLTPILEGTDR